MKTKNIAVIRCPGQGLEFKIDESARPQMPEWLQEKIGEMESDADIGQVLGRYVKAGNRYTATAPIRETKITGMLKSSGFNVSFHDFMIGGTENERPLLETKIGDNLHLRWTNYGALPLSYHDNEVISRAKNTLEQKLNGVDTVMISTAFAFENPTYAMMIKLLKQIGKKVVVGGPDAIASPNIYLQYGADLIFADDFDPANQTFRKLLNDEPLESYERVVIGTHRTAKDKIAYPAAIASDVSINLYTEGHDGPIPQWVKDATNNGPVWAIMFSYGCPNTCSFCDTARFNRKYSAIAVEDAKDAIDQLVQQGIKIVDVLDDNLLCMKPGDLRDIFAYMAENDMYWNFPNGLQVSKLIEKKELVDVLFSRDNDGNCRAFNMYWPLEKIKEGELDSVACEKLTTLEANLDMISTLAKKGVRIGCGAILFDQYDEQQFNDVVNVYDKVKKITGKNEVRGSVFHPIALGALRGTEIHADLDVENPSLLASAMIGTELGTIVKQGMKCFYTPVQMNGRNELLDKNLWPAFAQAYWLALQYRIDPHNVVQMVNEGKYGYN